MKRLIFSLLLTAVMSSPVLADDNDACAMVICLSAAQLRDGGQACLSAQQKFFKIIKYHDHSHAIDYGKTIEKRRKKLQGCDNARAADIERIMATYGGMINPL